MDPKRCFKCGETKPTDDFYRHPMMGDGRLGKCKVCTRRDVQENYRRHHALYRAYDKARYPARRAELAAGVRHRQKQNPAKARAVATYKNAVAKGRLQRQPCAVCGSKVVDGHHPDYAKPLEVLWLCRRHHMEQHRMEKVV
jgi:hypothetical protein